MEIMTCEQYVLAKLAEAERENEALRELMKKERDDYEARIRDYSNHVDLLTDQLEHMRSDLDVIRGRASIKLSSDKTSRYVSIDAPWEQYDRKDFDVFVRLLDLQEDEEVDKDE